MNKNDIKAKWGKYADTDKLVDDMMALLTKYDHRNTEHGVCCVLEKFFTNKEPLIKLLQKSDHYAGDLRIVLDEQLERRGNEYDIRCWVDSFPRTVGAHDVIWKTTDSHGKTMTDYLKIGKQKISIADLDNEEFKSTTASRNEALAEFTSTGITRASEGEYAAFASAISWFRYITSSTITGDCLSALADYKIQEGMKTSRAFNKICHHFGVDKSPKTITNRRGEKQRVYDIEFAKYADMVGGQKRQVKFFISVNPLDYLTMSFGVNWASCHTINRADCTNGYSGGYCGGTMSYMLDAVSIITYVHNTMPESHETGKVYRNMFHLGGEGVLLQGRIYPKGNDGCTDLYKEFRSIMQKELCKLFGLNSNMWTKRSAITNIESVGSHYRDYIHVRDCNISYPTERPQCQRQTMTVGSERICPHCGESADDLTTGSLAHVMCSVNPVVATTELF